MSTPRAADLPVGSIVASVPDLTDELCWFRAKVWIKGVALYGVGAEEEIEWKATGDGRPVYDAVIDAALDEGAQVLRVGDGTGQR